MKKDWLNVLVKVLLIVGMAAGLALSYLLLSGMGNTLSVAGLDGGIYIATINNGKTTEKIKFRK